MRENRIEKVHNLIYEKDLDACVIRGMDNIFYLTGFKGSEGTLVITKGDVLLITDFRYVTYANEVTKDVKIVELMSKKNVLSEICEKYVIRRMGFDSYHTMYKIYSMWKDTITNTEFIPLENEIEEIRQCKDPEEIDAIIKAVDISTNAFIEVFEKICSDKTEKEIADELEYTMRRMGADCPSFDTIVASGARAALPHAVPTNKKIKEGETIIIDFGSCVDGYCSDETCTILIGQVNGKIKEIFKIVNDARELGIEKARAGMSTKDLDMIVRGVIDDAGYGKFFGHGVGHGVGVAVHEAPSINSTGEGILEENMVITIEPGIYLPALGGVRLEDMLLITDNGTKVLTHIRKDMLQISI
ncbi:MAG: Xaa-Pro peptidase family protein [Proteobacteria bacterium]|nr:Xaa-Pro peptidase family protein [Pseudomonadota bacterium]